MKTINTLKSLPILGVSFTRDNNWYVTMKNHILDKYCIMLLNGGGGKWSIVTSNESYDSLCYSNLARMPQDLLEEVTVFDDGDEFVTNINDDFDSELDLVNRYKITLFDDNYYLLHFRLEYAGWRNKSMFKLSSLRWPDVIRYINDDVDSVIVHLQ